MLKNKMNIGCIILTIIGIFFMLSISRGLDILLDIRLPLNSGDYSLLKLKNGTYEKLQLRRAWFDVLDYTYPHSISYIRARTGAEYNGFFQTCNTDHYVFVGYPYTKRVILLTNCNYIIQRT